MSAAMGPRKQGCAWYLQVLLALHRVIGDQQGLGDASEWGTCFRTVIGLVCQGSHARALLLGSFIGTM